MRTRKILAVIPERFLGSFCKNAAIRGPARPGYAAYAT
jgi:hypothetical protein